jgi:glycosyltransferase involved in cell wall biosynthesis
MTDDRAADAPADAPGEPRIAGPDGPSILYITNGFPYPLTSGYLRHYHLIGQLAKRGYRVTLLSIVGRDHRPEDVAGLADRTVAVEVFASADRARGRASTFRRRLQRVLPGGGDPAARQLAARAGALTARGGVDAVVFSGKRTDAALPSLGDLPVVVDMCDATSLRLERELAVTSGARRLKLIIQRRQVRRTEARMLRRADRSMFASERDREALLTGQPVTSAIVPNGVDLDYWTRDGRSLGRDSLVFTGAMGYGPNVDAAIRLARRILPLVRTERPSAHLSIVGRDPVPDVSALGALPNVTVTGSVPDVRPYLAAASVFVAPLRFGAGIQNKLLEAMAMEVPSVVSPLAADGLRTADGSPPVVVADDDAAFAREIIHALSAADHSPAPDARARAYVERTFSWERSGRDLAGLIEAARRQRRATHHG